MKIIFVSILLWSFSNMSAQIKFVEYFLDKTLRFDFYHTGNNKSETISFDKIIEEGKWSGSKKELIDELQFGHYFLKVISPSDKREIYSRGFSTLYQEWQTTEEAKSLIRSMQGSISFPFPKEKVIVELYRRDRNNTFKKIFEKEIDPSSYFIIKERIRPYNSFKVHYSGEPTEKLDIVFIPEGYNNTEMEIFKEDCKRFTSYLFDYTPFKENQSKVNVWGVEAPSLESETDIPGKGIWKQTLLNSRFYTFDSERYLMTSDYHIVKDIASNAPYDHIYILVNTPKYGGGAIYNFYSMTSAYDKRANQIFIHELGHGLAGLGDEYGSDNTYQEMYPLDVEPWEPNLTTMVNFESKWKSLVEPSTPIPTPSNENYKNKIGVFEGGGYVAKGVFRPTYNSIMNSFTSNEFNIICKQVLEKVINLYAE